MKNFKATMMVLVLLLVGGASQAASAKDHDRATKDEVINTYLNAVVHGKLAGIDNAIDNDAEFHMTRGESVKTFNKEQILLSLKGSENTEQQCECTKSVVRDNDDAKTLKVDMKYSDFTRTDLITAERSGKDWKITKVETSFK
jgi:hypothetical protein